MSGSRTATQPPCESCEQHILTFYCASCDSDYCDDCWGKQVPHKPSKKGVDGLPHEKTDRQVLERLHKILSPPSTREAQVKLHHDDFDTTWFGIDQEDDFPVFQNYGRYHSIMSKRLSGDFRVRWPQLISFIGQTGAGKSTLVKMLIGHQEAQKNLAPSTFASPVVGSINNNMPTSADVHLYEDPGTSDTQQPFLWADCEGLEGGEIDPLAVKFKRDEQGYHRVDMKTEAVRKIRKVARSSRLEWANTPDRKRRQFAVTELYPRLLYTFSDVIVFVLRNSKTFEAVLEKLLSWAMASIEKSLNQPLLPHAIIALNATENSIDPNQWDPEVATGTLLRDVDPAIARVPKFANYAEYWKSRGKKIRTMKDLLHCFYSSVTVVRIPTKGRYMLINAQVGRLHDQITRACIHAHNTRQDTRMLCNADDLGTYLQCAFDHFSQDLDAPFDFIEMSLRNNPIPLDFRGNVLKLALAIRDTQQSRSLTGPHIFKPLSRMVASCIMLDFTRQKYQGEPLELLEKHYMEPCLQALYDFCNIHWPCSFQNKSGKCMNTGAGHSPKGHQNQQGKILATGRYESDFLAENYEEIWKNLLKSNLGEYMQGFRSERLIRQNWTEEEIAQSLHLKNMNAFYDGLGGANCFVSHSACFSCLRELPNHPLPCGHILCTTCVTDYGTVIEKYWVTMPHCPLHTKKSVWSEDFVIKMKPTHAGVRILSLDGGGVRGIIELEVLRAIQSELGGKIPIQSFFDLIVGTSTGGIISLGLGVEGWSVQSCLERFQKLVGRAFSPRDFHGLPLFQSVAFLHHQSRYRTRPLEAALVECFQQKCLFGGNQTTDRYRTKVAVLAASGTGQSAVVMANYNRADLGEDQDYVFEREEKPYDELKTWEAARATSAAPRYFKPFECSRTRKQYWDGALYHNNPVFVANHERKLIWPDTRDSHPDLILSVGTGFKNSQSDNKPSLFQADSTRPDTADTNMTVKDWKSKPHWQHLWDTLVNRVQDIIDSDRIWASFMRDNDPTTDVKSRYQRLNVDLGYEPPALDAVPAMEPMRDAAARQLRTQHNYWIQIHGIANQLVASSFYFEKDTVPTGAGNDDSIVTGNIHCRFMKGSSEVRFLGEHLCLQQKPSFQPYFSIDITEEDRCSFRSSVPIDEMVIHNMRERGVFEVAPISLTLLHATAETNMMLHLGKNHMAVISGFPRLLLTEDTTLEARHHARNPSASSSSSQLAGVASASSSTPAPQTIPTNLHSPPSSFSLRSPFQNRGRHSGNGSPVPSPNPKMEIPSYRQRGERPLPTPVPQSPANSESALPRWSNSLDGHAASLRRASGSWSERVASMAHHEPFRASSGSSRQAGRPEMETQAGMGTHTESRTGETEYAKDLEEALQRSLLDQ